MNCEFNPKRFDDTGRIKDSPEDRKHQGFMRVRVVVYFYPGVCVLNRKNNLED